MTHSPGPWKRGGEYSNNMDEIEDKDGRTIAAVWTRKGPQFAKASQQFREEPQGVANITLMIAAPDLLDALHDCLAIVQDEYDDDDEQDTIPSWKRAIDAARAAIAKATSQPVSA